MMKELGLDSKKFVLVTLHRPSNVDEKNNLEKILLIFRHLGEKVPIIFPVHPRTKKMFEENELEQQGRSIPNLHLAEPMGYLEFLSLMEHAGLIITDSGGIQEETTYLGIPCLTLRENTERPVTVEAGTNELCGLNVPHVVDRANKILEGHVKKGRIPELWDGKTGERITEILAKAM